jgi:serine/threonine-protein kinase
VGTRTPTDRSIRDHLERVLSSTTFRASGQLRRFLNFIANETLLGRSAELKEYTIGVHVFDRTEHFDPRTDPVVRVQARRLRDRLVRYYRDEGAHDQIVVELPKGGYAPTFKERDVPATRHREARRPVARNTIAVAPVGAAPDLEPFADGLTRGIVRRLLEVKDLRVLSEQRASEAIANLLLVGNLNRAAEGIRLTVELIDQRSGFYLMSEWIDVGSTHAFASQDQLSDAVVEKISRHLAPQHRTHGTENLTARNLCLQGHYQLELRTDDALELAAKWFERAIIEDPQYSLAHSGLSDAYCLLANYGVRPAAPLLNMALANAATAVMLDVDSAPAHTSLAHAKAAAHWDYLGAETEFQRAITLDAAYAPAHHWYARSCLIPLGRLDQALEECILAHAADPASSIAARELAVIHYFRRDFEKALAHCDQTIELNPHFANAYFTLSLVQEQLGDTEEALAALLRAVQLAPRSPRMISALGWAQAKAGHEAEALASLAELNALAKSRYVTPWDKAVVFLGLGDTEQALTALLQAYEERCFELTLLLVDPRFEPLRGHKTFLILLQRLGLR